jgi:hypothetical protein
MVFGDRVAATAAFHPGGLVTDQPDSPHTRVKTIKSRVYLAPAIGGLPPEAEAKLRAELESAHIRYEIEQYDAKHGYAVDDSDVYDRAAAERHYAALTKEPSNWLRCTGISPIPVFILLTPTPGCYPTTSCAIAQASVANTTDTSRDFAQYHERKPAPPARSSGSRPRLYTRSRAAVMESKKGSMERA